jgi:hypothetical protein
MENTLMTTAQTAYNDYTQAFVGMYLSALHQWKSSYERASRLQSYEERQVSPEVIPSPAARSTPKNYYVQGYRRAIENNMSLCRFFERRWYSYTGLPERVAALKSPLDVFSLQAEFLSTVAEDYINEAARAMRVCLR